MCVASSILALGTETSLLAKFEKGVRPLTPRDVNQYAWTVVRPERL